MHIHHKNPIEKSTFSFSRIFQFSGQLLQFFFHISVNQTITNIFKKMMNHIPKTSLQFHSFIPNKFVQLTISSNTMSYDSSLQHNLEELILSLDLHSDKICKKLPVLDYHFYHSVHFVEVIVKEF
jgi:hypothetical protein